MALGFSAEAPHPGNPSVGRPGWPFTCGDPGLCVGEGTGGGAPQRESLFSSTSHTCPEEGAREPARRRGCEAGPPSKSSEVTAHEDETQKEPESERITRYQTGESTEQSPRHAGSAGRRGEGPPRDGRLPPRGHSQCAVGPRHRPGPRGPRGEVSGLRRAHRQGRSRNEGSTGRDSRAKGHRARSFRRKRRQGEPLKKTKK